MSKGDKKNEYVEKVVGLFQNNKSLFLTKVDNVSSTQMHQIRRDIRGKATFLMGKNSLIRRALAELVPGMPELEPLVPHIRGNIGIVFTNQDIKTIVEIVTSNRISAPAKVGAISQCNVVIPLGGTGMGPDKTSFFQALGIATKVVKGTIEITSEVEILKLGDVVSASAAELLLMMNILPFTYGCEVSLIYDNGSIFSPELLKISEERVRSLYQEGITRIAAASLAMKIPTIVSIPHTIMQGYKNLLAVSLASDYTFEGSEKLKHILENPELFVNTSSADNAAKKEEPSAQDDKDEESDDGFGDGFSLFDS